MKKIILTILSIFLVNSITIAQNITISEKYSEL